MAASSTYVPLATIGEDGKPPASRLTDARAVNNIVWRMLAGNEKRSKTDALVYGLVSGNPPYSRSELVKNAQSWRCNTNWRIAESFLNIALSMYWDAVSEAGTYCSIRTGAGNDEQQSEWSQIITEEFDRLNKNDTSLNYMHRLSHFDMVLFRCGPVMFEDAWNFRARPIKQSKLLLPDSTQSNVDNWKLAVVLVDYSADELYSFIRNPKAASAIGYFPQNVRDLLMKSAPNDIWPQNHRYNWEWYEQRIRNNDLYFSNICEKIPVAHVYFREFPKEDEPVGKISHCMVSQNEETDKFLFRRVGRFEKWQNVIHPFYYDTGDGTHHSVKGLGIKAYGALETYNRMECHAVDCGIWSSATHFQATDSAALQDLAVINMGPWIMHKPGANYLQTNMGSQLNGLMAVKQDLLTTVTSNLAQYRQDVSRKSRPSSEAPTARQISYEAENESVIGRSGMSWYFEQADEFYKERFRRASNPNLVNANPGGKEALEFQARCIHRGVAPVALRKIESVLATRTVGYGSADARMQSMMRMMARLPMYSETGRQRILQDLTRMDAGEAGVKRYMPDLKTSSYEMDQEGEAAQWVGTMKTGVPFVPSPSQNPNIYGRVFLMAAAQSTQSLQQGAKMEDVFNFLEQIGPAIKTQLDRMQGDHSREQELKAMDAQWRQLTAIHDNLAAQLKKRMAERIQQQKQLAQQSAQVDGELALKAKETQGKLTISQQKAINNQKLREWMQMQKMQMERQAHGQDLALADAQTASEITRKNATAAATVSASRTKPKNGAPK